MRVVLCDDHELFREGVELLLKVRGVDVTSYTGPVTGFVDWVEQDAPDVVLLDLDLGAAGTAVPLIEPLRATGAVIVIITGISAPLLHAGCIEAGAAGVVSKQEPLTRLVEQLDRAVTTGSLLTKDERDEMLRRLRIHRGESEHRLAPFRQLSPREEYVLARLMDGENVTAIAESSVVSITTVRSQVRAILTKLGVRSQLAAVSAAERAGWVPRTTVR